MLNIDRVAAIIHSNLEITRHKVHSTTHAAIRDQRKKRIQDASHSANTIFMKHDTNMLHNNNTGCLSQCQHNIHEA